MMWPTYKEFKRAILVFALMCMAAGGALACIVMAFAVAFF